MIDRISIDEYFMRMVELVSLRSTCLRRKVGAILVKDNMAISMGYNGSPTKTLSCLEKGICLREQLKVPSRERYELCNAVHAEQNAIIQAARHNSNPEGSTLYCTDSPCATCAKMLINCRIVRVVYKNEAVDDIAFSMFKEAGTELVKYEIK